MFSGNPEEIVIGDEELKEMADQQLNDAFVNDGKLVALPPQLANCTRLKKLTIGTNTFTEIPEAIMELTQLEELEISSGKITELSPKLFNLTNLKTLLLYGNKITAIPPEISQLTKLTELNLFDNKIKGAKGVPASINELVNLENLNLGNNSFIQFPVIDKLTKLEEFRFQWGKVFKMNGSWENLTRLKVVMGSDNRVMDLPALPPSLTTLDMNGNNLNSTECLAKCSNLEELFLNGNGLDSLPANIFTDKLVLLKAEKNKLKSIPDEISNATALTGIFMEDNQLETIPEGILKCTKLIRANFKSNQNLAGDATCAKIKEIILAQSPPGNYWD